MSEATKQSLEEMRLPFLPLSQPAARSSTGTYCSTADCLCAAATWSNWENHSLQITGGENPPLFLPEKKYFQKCGNCCRTCWRY